MRRDDPRRVDSCRRRGRGQQALTLRAKRKSEHHPRLPWSAPTSVVGLRRLAVEILGHPVDRWHLEQPARQIVFQVEIALGGIAKPLACIAGEVAVETHRALCLDAHRRAAEQVVDDGQPLVVVNQTDQSFRAACGIVDRVVRDQAVLGVVGQNAVFRAAGDEVVANDAAAQWSFDRRSAVRSCPGRCRCRSRRSRSARRRNPPQSCQRKMAPRASPVRPRMPTKTLSRMVQPSAYITSMPPM